MRFSDCKIRFAIHVTICSCLHTLLTILFEAFQLDKQFIVLHIFMIVIIVSDLPKLSVWTVRNDRPKKRRFLTSKELGHSACDIIRRFDALGQRISCFFLSSVYFLVRT